MVTKVVGEPVRVVWAIGNDGEARGFTQIKLVVGGIGEFFGNVTPVPVGEQAVQEFFRPQFLHGEHYFAAAVLRWTDSAGDLIENLDNFSFTIDTETL